jgi:protein SCO1/2
MILRFLMLTFVCGAAFAEGQGSLQTPKALEGIEITDRLGAKLDQNLKVVRQDGDVVPLSTYFGSSAQPKLPAIVTLGYFECPMLCSLVLNALLESLQKVKLELGRDFRILSFSINPKEKSDLALNKQKTHLKALDLKTGAWDFFTSEDDSIARLAETLGFGYKFDKASGEYAHAAGIFIVSPEGVLTRTFWGINYDPFALKMALMESAQGKVGTALDKILLSCFHYVPDSHKYGIYVFGVMRLGATLTVLILGSMLFGYWLRERRRRIGVL